MDPEQPSGGTETPVKNLERAAQELRTYLCEYLKNGGDVRDLRHTANTLVSLLSRQKAQEGKSGRKLFRKVILEIVKEVMTSIRITPRRENAPSREVITETLMTMFSLDKRDVECLFQESGFLEKEEKNPIPHY